MIKKVIINIKDIYHGIKSILFQALSFSGIRAAKIISAAGSIAAVVIIAAALFIEAIFSIPERISSNEKTIRVTPVYQSNL